MTTPSRPWLPLYPAGIGPTLQPRYSDMLTLWGDAVTRHGDDPCVYYFDQELSYGQVDRWADAFAASLQADGFGSGERLGILVQNDPQWLIGLLGCWKAGGIAVSLSPMLKQRELQFQLRDAQVAVLLCLENLYRDVVEPIVAGTGVRAVLTTHPVDWLGGGEAHPVIRASAGAKSSALRTPSLREVLDGYTGRRPDTHTPRPEDVAVLTYTSGTTGPPKGAMVTHGGISYNAQILCEWFAVQADQPILGIAPLFHVTGLVAHLGMSWYAGAAVVLGHRFDADQVLHSIEVRRPAFTIGAITAYIALLNHPDFTSFDLSSLTTVASGGAPVTMAVVNRFRDRTGLTIRTVYGLTETTSPSHLTPPRATSPVDPASGVLSVGVPVPGALAEVVDMKSGEPLPPGEIGEIVISGPMVVPGYWNRPEESAATFPGGRLFTGDVGFMNSDGWFFVVDRKKDLIIASGYKVWPREVEEVLYEHPAVREAAVVGVPDSYRGETVVAHVSLVPGVPATEQELIDFCCERLASYKYPRHISIIAELPKTSSGKLLRRELKQRGAR